MIYYITEISEQKRKKGRYNVYTDDGFLLSLSDETIVKNSIKRGSELTEEQLNALREEDTFKYAKELSFKYAAGAMRSEKQIKAHLLRCGVDADTADRAVETMREYGYADDERFAREYAKGYLRKYSAYVVTQRLLAEGISAKTAAEAVKEADDAENLTALFGKYARKYEKDEPLKRKKHICDALARRGFSWSEISGFFDGDEF